MNRYHGDFGSWNDVAIEFYSGSRYEDGALEKALKEIPEPEEVLYADYDTPGYEGDARVVYRNGDVYYYVNAGHCSCYGLEDQFNPDEYTKDDLLAYLEKQASNSYSSMEKKMAIEVLKVLSE